MMTTKLCVLLFLLSSIALTGQELNLLSDLGNNVQETSGLIFVDGRIVTHNDSGDQARLLELDEVSGAIRRHVTIENAQNKDWEDIDLDDSFIYIGDIGNNSGTRKDLRIYKISLVDYLDEDNTARAEIIEFSYENQTDFTPASQETNFDAEGLIAFGNSLYVFTKNWIDNRTHVYKIPKEPGVHVAVRTDEFDSRGLITGAAYSTSSDRIMLVGYAGLTPFLTELSGFSNGKFSNGRITRTELNVPTGTSVQIEAVAFDDKDRLLISSEENFSGDASLMYISLSTLSENEFESVKTMIYPNPVRERLWLEVESPVNRIEIYDYNGRLILKKKVNSDSVSLEELPSGQYLIRLFNDSGSTMRKLIRQ